MVVKQNEESITNSVKYIDIRQKKINIYLLVEPKIVIFSNEWKLS